MLSLDRAGVVARLAGPVVADVGVQLVDGALLADAVLGDVQELDPLQVDVHFYQGEVVGDSELLHVQDQDVWDVFHGFRLAVVLAFAFLALHLDVLGLLVQAKTILHFNFIIAFDFLRIGRKTIHLNIPKGSSGTEYSIAKLKLRTCRIIQWQGGCVLIDPKFLDQHLVVQTVNKTTMRPGVYDQGCQCQFSFC